MIQLGQTVGNYRVTAMLGEGGMGSVFLAEHPVIGRKVALKVVHPQHARNLEVVGRFVNEATAISHIGHEHIVEVMDLGRTSSGDFYFVMEYLDGHPLSELIGREAPLAPERAVAIAAQIADALGASHEQGIVHRDLKPENVFLVRRGADPDFVKVLDFGLAKLVHAPDGARHDTAKGTVMGTPYYMAPEQCRVEGVIDHRADIYALGVVLFEMVTGKLPFGGDLFSDVLVKQVTMRAPWARSLVPAIPAALDEILQRALAKHADERFPSMAAFREALLTPLADGAVPHHAVADDRSTRMRDARPMSRAEIVSLPRDRRDDSRVTPRPLAIEDDPSLDRVPRHLHARALALVAATVGGVALAALLTRGDGHQSTAHAAETPRLDEARARTVLVRFGSDPDGATVTSADGTALGATPLSVQVPASAAPVEYVFHKPGFAPRTVSFVPNAPSTTFALLRAATSAPTPTSPDAADVAAATARADEPTSASAREDEPTPAPDELGDPPAPRDLAPARRADDHTHRHHVAAPAEASPSPLDDDGVLQPSFLK